jgi:hypothetical protein
MLSTALALAACSGNYDNIGHGPAMPGATATAELVALTNAQHLVSFDRAAPATLVTDVNVSGLASGERLLAVAWRPSEGKLLGVSASARLFVVDALSGKATLRASLSATPGDDSPYAALNATSVALALDPAHDRLRAVTNAGQNLDINPDTGAVVTHAPVQRGGTVVAPGAIAYADAFGGAARPTLWTINAATDALEQLPAPDTGALTGATSLGLDATYASGLVIDPHTGQAYAALAANGRSAWYTVNLDAGALGGATVSRVADLGTQDALLSLALIDPKGASLSVQAVGLSTDARLVKFESSSPQIVTLVPLTGLNANETLLTLDFRPADGLLYGISNAGRVLRIDAATGAVTRQAFMMADASDASAPYAGLAGASFSASFDPVLDRMRVISNVGQNLLINVSSGATTTDALVQTSGSASVVAALAYDNRLSAAGSSSLRAVDILHQRLALFAQPSDGLLTDLAGLGLPAGVNLNGLSAWSIAGGRNGLALLAVQATSGGSVLFDVNLATGNVTAYPDPSAAVSAATNRVGGSGGPTLKALALKL